MNPKWFVQRTLWTNLQILTKNRKLNAPSKSSISMIANSSIKLIGLLKWRFYTAFRIRSIQSRFDNYTLFELISSTIFWLFRRLVTVAFCDCYANPCELIKRTMLSYFPIQPSPSPICTIFTTHNTNWNRIFGNTCKFAIQIRDKLRANIYFHIPSKVIILFELLDFCVYERPPMNT